MNSQMEKKLKVMETILTINIMFSSFKLYSLMFTVIICMALKLHVFDSFLLIFSFSYYSYSPLFPYECFLSL